jgi:hypothetical protein
MATTKDATPDVSSESDRQSQWNEKSAKLRQRIDVNLTECLQKYLVFGYERKRKD